MPNLDLFFSTTLFLTEKADAQNKKSRAFFFAAGHPLLWTLDLHSKFGHLIFAVYDDGEKNEGLTPI